MPTLASIVFGITSFNSQLTNLKVLLDVDLVGSLVVMAEVADTPAPSEGIGEKGNLGLCWAVDSPNTKRPSGCLYSVDLAATTPLVALTSSDAIPNPGLFQLKLFLTKFV